MPAAPDAASAAAGPFGFAAPTAACFEPRFEVTRNSMYVVVSIDAARVHQPQSQSRSRLSGPQVDTATVCSVAYIASIELAS